jgi:hypothetical protein
MVLGGIPPGKGIRIGRHPTSRVISDQTSPHRPFMTWFSAINRPSVDSVWICRSYRSGQITLSS